MNIVDEVVTKYDIDAIHLMIISILIRITGENFNDTASYKNTEKT
jgi:uncharacterized lipoprotein YddW (UPF0748 family)